jgi:hypothetical protein
VLFQEVDADPECFGGLCLAQRQALDTAPCFPARSCSLHLFLPCRSWPFSA